MPEEVVNEALTLNLKVRNKQTQKTIATQQLVVRECESLFEKVIATDLVDINETAVEGVLEVSSGDLMFIFDVVRGSFTKLTFKGQEILAAQTLIDIWRAPTDNDRNKKNEWLHAGFNRTKLKNIDYKVLGDCIHAKYALVATGYQPILEFELVLSVAKNQLSFDINAQKAVGFPDLPRFGITLPLISDFTTLTYFGNGPYESYSDKKSAGSLGIYSLDIAKQERYVKPQEYGNHVDTKWLCVSNQQVTLEIKQPNNFSYRPFSKEQLTTQVHDGDLVEEGNYLTLDYKQNGIGSNSCGPYVEEKYRFDEEMFNWKFQMGFK